VVPEMRSLIEQTTISNDCYKSDTGVELIVQKHRPWIPVAGALAAGLIVSNRTVAEAQNAATVAVNSSGGQS